MPGDDKQHLVFVTALADTAAIREVTHLGKPHLVIPVVMISEGVMNGTLYRSEVMEVGYGAWNGKPTVYRHPERGGLPVSANEPSVYEEETLGTLFSTKVESQKLKAEMYLDVERIEAFGGEKAEALTRLQSGDPVEVSTGFWAVEIQQGGTFGGTDYTRVATAIFPDHLAILAPDQTGACSVEDGCGAPRINQAACSCGGACRACKPEETDMPEPIVLEAVTEDGTEGRHIYRLPEGQDGCIGSVQADLVESSSTIGLLYNADRSAVRLPAAPRGEVQAELLEEKASIKEIVVNALRQAGVLKANMTMADVRSALFAALDLEGKDRWPWVIDVEIDPSAVIYERDDMSVVRRTYEIRDDGTVVLGADMELVRRETSYVPVQIATEDTEEEEDQTMTTNDRVASLIANQNSPFEEGDTEYLAGLSEDRLKEFEAAFAAEPKVETEQKVNATDRTEVEDPKTVEEALAALPQQFRGVLADSLRTHEAKVKELIEKIVATGYKVHSEDELRAMDVERLQALAEFAAPKTFSGRGMPRSDVAAKTNEAETPNYPVYGDNDPLAKAVN